MNPNRRAFLSDVGKGMLLATVGPALASDLGLASAHAADGPERLTFGDREPLVSLMQETPADKLLPLLTAKIKDGADLGSLVAAGALANARTFGGQDYTGYHAFMALVPSYAMSKELPAEQKALPVLKVLYRNTQRMQDVGGSKREILHPIAPAELPKDHPEEAVRDAVRKRDFNAAEGAFAALVKGPLNDAYNDLLLSVQDEVDVHRVVLAWRAWAVLELAGKEHAKTLLRQSVRFCCNEMRNGGDKNLQALLPKLLDQHKLLSKASGTKKAENAWVEHLAETVYGAGRAKAAEAVAAALAEGFSPEDVGEAISLAANRLLLCDPGRSKKDAQPGKPEGSIHGASVGVHASDAANAWRNIARVSNQRNTIASLIVAAYHTGGQTGGQTKQPFPLPEQLEKITSKDAAVLLRDLEGAIKEKNLNQACALVQRSGELEHPARPIFDVLLKFAVSEDGALHAEKYYRTVTEEFAATRPAFRWRQLAALARVTASEYGFPAAGYAEACKLMKG
jgi:hypothetical protein